MTNTIYFHNTLRDDVSTTTEEEETPHTSNRYTHQQGLNPFDDNYDAKDVSSDSSEIFSLNSFACPPWVEYSNSKEFSFNELKTATRNFHNDDILGEGGFGSVFKGWIDENKLTATNPGEGIPVAIKRLERHLSFHGKLEFEAEVNYGRFYHPNLLRLLGYCSDNEERLLVYEFMPQGSLDKHLFESVSTPLPWSVRMKIALGAAKGLAFLHSTPINVIHRDCKSSNILLDTDYNAKLSDFGLAMDGPTGDETHVDTMVMGTYGYAAPEYIVTGHLTAKCDVYTFGVVLLEMLSGRRVIDKNRPSGERELVDWAKPYLNHKRKVYRVADSRLKGQYSLEGFQKAANLALICLSVKGMARPNMDEVVKVLGEL